jgi:hypothetical protein
MQKSLFSAMHAIRQALWLCWQLLLSHALEQSQTRCTCRQASVRHEALLECECCGSVLVLLKFREQYETTPVEMMAA